MKRLCITCRHYEEGSCTRHWTSLETGEPVNYGGPIAAWHAIHRHCGVTLEGWEERVEPTEEQLTAALKDELERMNKE